MTEYSHRELLALDRIEDLLQAYAEARLAPSAAALGRMRTAVVAKAAQRAATGPSRLGTHRAGRQREALPDFKVPRRALALGLAATLALGTTAAVFAAPPGSPFYGARVAIENALAPNNSNARLVTHEHRLTQLVADAQVAADDGDDSGLDAALVAYQDEVDAAVADLGDAPDRLTHLERELGKHVAVLTGLEAKLPAQAAIEHALVASQKALEKLQDKGGQQGGRPSHAPHHPTKAPSTDGGHGRDNAHQ